MCAALPQIWAGVVGSTLAYVLFVLSFPYNFLICDWVQSASLLQLLLTYVSAFLFVDDGSDEAAGYRTDLNGGLLVGVNCFCFFVLLWISAANAVRQQRAAMGRRLRYSRGGAPVKAKGLSDGLSFHLFLSHVLSHGPDLVERVSFPPPLTAMVRVSP